MGLPAAGILARFNKPMEHIVAIGSDHQLAYGQTHTLGIVASKDITKVTGRHSIVQRIGGLGLRDLKPTIEIVGNLSHDTRPVDTIDSAKIHSLLEVLVGEGLLHQGLAIVKVTLDLDAVHIFIRDGRHLPLLDVSHLALGVQNKAVHILLATQAINSSTASVTTSSTQDGYRILDSAPSEEVLEQVAQKLQGHILKSKCRAMEQLKHPEILVLDARSASRLITNLA